MKKKKKKKQNIVVKTLSVTFFLTIIYYRYEVNVKGINHTASEKISIATRILHCAIGYAHIQER